MKIVSGPAVAMLAALPGLLLAASAGAVLSLAPVGVGAVTPNSETILCEPGQVEDSDLGICKDPDCPMGTIRDPSGQTRTCMVVQCPGQAAFNLDTGQCLPAVGPAPKCPDGSVGKIDKLKNGVSVVECPKTLPNPHHRPGPSPIGPKPKASSAD